jgi:outer membrane usher protein FimD/PapC
MLFRILVVVISIFSGSVTSLADSYVEEKALVVFAGDMELGLLLIIETEDGNFIADSSIPEGLMDPDAYSGLERHYGLDCEPCLLIEDFAHFTEDTAAGSGVMVVKVDYLPVQEINYRKARNAGDVVLQSRPGVSGNISVSARDDSELEQPVYSGSLSLDLSFGALGVIRGGFRAVSDEQGIWEETMLPTYFERHWVNSRVTLTAGETSVETGRNSSSISMLGFKVYRNFSTRPDLLSTPAFDFFTTLERPSTIEIYIDSEKKRTEEFSSPGRVNISRYQPSTSGKVSLIVTDALGSTIIFEEDFYRNGQLLGTGVWDFSFSAGQVREGAVVIDDEYATGGLLRRGITNQLTLGVSGGAVHRQDNRNDYIVGFNAILGSSLGTLELESKYRDFELEGLGEAHAINWTTSKDLTKSSRLSLGFTGFYEENFGGFYGESKDTKGGRAFINMSVKSLYVGFAHSDIGETRSNNASIGYRWRSGISLSAGYQQIKDIEAGNQNDLISLNVAYNFGGKGSGVDRISLGAGKINPRGDVNSQLQLSGSAFDTSMNWSAKVFHDEKFGTENDRGELNLSYRGENGAVNYRGYREDLVDDDYEQTIDLTTGFALGPNLAGSITGPQSRSTGFAIIDADKPGIKIKAGGRDVYTNWRGLALIPVTGFQRSYVTLDFNSLPDGLLVDKSLLEVSVLPRQFSYVKFDLKAPGAFIVVEGARSGETIEVNGERGVYYSSGMFVENLVIGKNTIKRGRATYILEILEPDSSFPTYEVKQ